MNLWGKGRPAESSSPPLKEKAGEGGQPSTHLGRHESASCCGSCPGSRLEAGRGTESLGEEGGRGRVGGKVEHFSSLAAH